MIYEKLKEITDKVFHVYPGIKIGDKFITSDNKEVILDYPYIVYSEALDKGVLYADDMELAKSLVYDVSVINNCDTNVMADLVIEKLKEINFERELKHDMYKDDSYVKYMRFRGGKING